MNVTNCLIKFDTTIFIRLLADFLKSIFKSIAYKYFVIEWE